MRILLPFLVLFHFAASLFSAERFINIELPCSHALTRDWDPDHFTDPNKHQESEFIYVVHGIDLRPPEEIDFRLQLSVIEERLTIEEARLIRSRTPQIIQDPSRVSQKLFLSASLVSNRFPHAWEKWGVILRVPPQNIVGTGPEDIGFPVDVPYLHPEKAQHEAEAFRKKNSIVSPSALIERSLKLQSKYNEVALLGETQSGGKVEVSGFFLSDEKIKSQPAFAEVEAWRIERGLPLISFQPNISGLRKTVTDIEFFVDDLMFEKVAVRLPEIGGRSKEERNLAKRMQDFGFSSANYACWRHLLDRSIKLEIDKLCIDSAAGSP